jgi:hypothetical protein
MSVILFSCRGGTVVLPDRTSLLISREDGGNLVVNPPRAVWERSELTPVELASFAFRVAACGRAMLRTQYGLLSGDIAAWSPFDNCGYPAPVAIGEGPHLCDECRPRSG